LWALVELPPEKDVGVNLAVLDVVELEVIEFQFFGGHISASKIHTTTQQSERL
jgi:hypothetical protein